MLTLAKASCLVHQEVAVGNARKYVDSLSAESMSVVVNTILAGYVPTLLRP